MPESKKRIQAVREFRSKSKRKQTQKAALKPQEYGQPEIPTGPSIILPQVSSQRRKYIPVGFANKDVYCGDKLRVIDNGTMYQFGIITSQFHNAWNRAVAGRLKDDYQYSAYIVYNNFIWPTLNETDGQWKRGAVELAAENILIARSKYPGSTLSELYDPDNDFLFPELIAAHQSLDSAVEEAYGVNFDGDEQKIVDHLFKLFTAASPQTR